MLVVQHCMVAFGKMINDDFIGKRGANLGQFLQFIINVLYLWKTVC